MRHLRINGHPHDRRFSRRAETLLAYLEHLGFLAGGGWHPTKKQASFYLDSHPAGCCDRIPAGPKRVTAQLRASIDAHLRSRGFRRWTWAR